MDTSILTGLGTALVVSLLAGLVCMVATKVTVESELLRPVRDVLLRKGLEAGSVRSRLLYRYSRYCWIYLADLVHCPLCTAFWHSTWSCWLIVSVLQVDSRYICLSMAAAGVAVLFGRFENRTVLPPTDGSVDSILKRLDD